MKVTVHNLYDETSAQFEGTEENVRGEILRHYPWLAGPHDETAYDLVEHLEATQAFDAEINDHDFSLHKAEYGERDKHVVRAYMGSHEGNQGALAAAKFLAGPDRVLDEKLHRQALYDHDGCHKKAALAGYGMEVNEKNLKALEAVSNIGTFKKSAWASNWEPESVKALTSEAASYATSVRNAMKANSMVPIDLGGKHSEGTLLARDSSTDTVLLLKPGSGGPGPAAGSGEGPDSPHRETAFYAMAQSWMLNEYIPETQLLDINGKYYAAIEMLPHTYQTIGDLNEANPNEGQRLLLPYQNSGVIWKWAVLDLVLHNVDRHANNLMALPATGDVKLIDQGGAFAGYAFDPADDRATFVPYYLRAWAGKNFNNLTPEDKLKALPRLGRSGENMLRQWILNLDEADMVRILSRFGVNPQPHLITLGALKQALQAEPSDVAVNSLWLEI